MQPTLHTERLLIRPFRWEDAPEVQKLAGDFAVADTTKNVPHPYEPGMAESWISGHPAQYAAGRLASFAITTLQEDRLIGCIGLSIDATRKEAELGYWIGVPFWSQGYCSEAARAVIDFGFDLLKLRQITACHMIRNPASGRVMEKAGMQLQRNQKRKITRWGKGEDVAEYIIHNPHKSDFDTH